MGPSILFSLSLQFLTILFTVCSANNSSNIKKWCNKTPNSLDCEYLIQSNYPLNLTIKGENEFRKVLLEVARNKAVEAKIVSSAVVGKLETKKQKDAWIQCSKEFESAINQLSIAQEIKSTKNETSRLALSRALASVGNCETESSVVLYRLIENVISIDDGKENVTTHSSRKLGEKKKKHKKSKKHKKGKKHKHHHKKQNHRHHKKGHHGKNKGCRRGRNGPHCGGKPRVRPVHRNIRAGNRIVVAKDGSGNYRTINEAVSEAARRRESTSERIVIYVKAGDYYENVDINIPDITLEGDGKRRTNIVGNKYHNGVGSTTKTRTVGIRSGAERFIARRITVKNVADASHHQAVALMSEGDGSTFYQCGFESHQDTLYAKKGRQFYRECDIHGSTDFIMGDAAAVFQNCDIYLRRPLDNKVTIAASSRQTNGPTGLVIQNSRVLITNELREAMRENSRIRIFLGRPWKRNARTVYIRTLLPERISEGYMETNKGEFNLNNVFHGEFANYGPGADTSDRVEWGGVHFLSQQEAEQFTVDRFIQGNTWIPSDVPRDGGL